MFAIRFKPRRKLKLTAQFKQRLVRGKARLVGGNLKQNSPRLSEVDALEILAVHNLSHADATLTQLLLPYLHGRQVWRAKCNVVHGATGLHAALAHPAENLNLRARGAVSHGKTGPARVLAGEVHAEQLLQHKCGWVDHSFRKLNRVQSTDGVLGRDATHAIPTAS